MNTNYSILLVDDEPDLIEIFTYVLKKKGLQVFSAPNATEGLEIIRKNPDIQLIVSDQSMPDLRGWDFFLKLKDILGNPRFLLMTGSVDVSTEKAYSSGMSGVLRKPIDNDYFVDAVLRTLEAPDVSVRQSERQPAWVEVRVASDQFPDSSDRALALNISSGGLFLGGTSIRPIGSKLRLEFEWKGMPYAVPGVVVWNRQKESYLPRGMGIRFEKNIT